MNCQTCQNFLDQHADSLESLEAIAEGDLAAHLDACSACRDKLRSIQDSWSLLTEALEPIPPSSNLTETLFGTVDRMSSEREAGRSFQWSRYAVAATVLIIATATIYITRYHPTRPDVAAKNYFEELAQIQEEFGRPGLVYVSLEDKQRPDTHAWILFDPDANQVHFFAPALKSIGDARYQLWILEEGNILSSALLNVSDEGLGAALCSVTPGHPKLEVMVTVEREEATTVPSGDVVLRTFVQFVK